MRLETQPHPPDKTPTSTQPEAPTGRGPLARAALIAAGVKVFGDNSLESSTTRDIAQCAGQNISAIAYYFGNKQGLYLAVAHHIADSLSQRLGPLLDDIEGYLQTARAPCDSALRWTGQLMAATLHTHTEMLAVTNLVVKEQMNPTQAFDILYTGCLERLHRLGAQLIDAYAGPAPDATDTALRFHALLGQSLAFRLARETVIRRAGWTRIDGHQMALIEGVVVDQAQDALRGLRQRRMQA